MKVANLGEAYLASMTALAVQPEAYGCFSSWRILWMVALMLVVYHASSLSAQVQGSLNGGVQLADVTQERRIGPKDNLYRAGWMFSAGLSAPLKRPRLSISLGVRYSYRMPLTIGSFSSSLSGNATSNFIINGVPTHPRYAEFRQDEHLQHPAIQTLDARVIPLYSFLTAHRWRAYAGLGGYVALTANRNALTVTPSDYGPFVKELYDIANQGLGVQSSEIRYAKWDAGGIVSMRVTYKISSRCHLMVDPSFSYGFRRIQSTGKAKSHWEAARWKVIDLPVGFLFRLTKHDE